MKHMKKRKRIVLSFLCAFLMIIAAWTVWGNVTVKTTHYDISSSKLPEGFDGYKIVQVSDLHNAVFGKDNKTLTEKIKAENPDIIVLTGDLVDKNHTDIDAALSFVGKIIRIAPCYYCTGNHEYNLHDEYEVLEKGLKKLGVNVLRNTSVTFTKNGDSVQLFGADDPLFSWNLAPDYASGEIIKRNLADVERTADYTILISHRPEIFETYVEMGFDLVFSGHAHGGQFRIPFVGGVIAPNQGLFPEYDCGLYEKDGTVMAVSRGIGNSIIPVRINNRPEIVCVTLHR